jgi:hypothetical protein
MLDVTIVGVMMFGIGLLGYISWTRGRSDPPTGYALGTIRGTQFAMGVGILLFAIGFIGLVVESLF